MYNKSMDCRYSKNQEHDKKICKVFWGGGFYQRRICFTHIWAKKWPLVRKQHINDTMGGQPDR